VSTGSLFGVADASLARPVLRPYQHEAIRLVDDALARGCRAPLLCLATGSGKTVIAAEIIRRAVSRGERTLFLAPRRELIWQTSAKLRDVGVEHGLLLAGAEHREDRDAAVQVASIDTVLARAVRRDTLQLPDVGVVIVDEAHLSVTKARHELLHRWPDAVRIGLTATPTRRDGRALGLLYDALLEPITVADLTAAGFLVRARYFSLSEPDLRGVRLIAGDYHQGELDAAVNQPKLVGDVVQHWLTHANDRRTVVFASSIAHSVALCEAFCRAGVAAEHVDASTPREVRDEMFVRFRQGRTQVLCNCFLASYGFDLPDLSCVVLARPTKSLMLYLQMLGRGLRPAPGKSDCLVLDHAGAVHQHGFATDARLWTLDGHDALEPAPARAGTAPVEGEGQVDCPTCHAVFAQTRICPECGHVLRRAGRAVETRDGTLVEIGEGREPDEQDRMVFYLELRGYAEEHGFRAGWAAHKYRERHATFPPWLWNQLTSLMPTTATRRWVHGRQMAWIRERQSSARTLQQEVRV
jgi:DNA repair protein RadD